eukprot:CAMPEP_0181228438 /NCGR_PEP_ID=MMETSP1096-20121128/33347_1 /TAXON_ID=156174 ORGANISM="Chrysochromulina ericina, Strain CCMP281" /NCGR_SAMPLE_ID=MMETSP1096 /ASSEMBLY_ACC=CAM_ASM_000453 /LENGTH=299 /DNA_ID=CAMNT_0023321961 /DNA_START=11 /DNA_END=906 /DNA_ORIENTATION=+
MSPPPAAAPGDPRYTVGSVVGPYLLLEKVDSLPSTWAPSAPLLPRSSPAAAGSGTRLQALGTGSGRWSSLLLPDTELLTALEVPSVNETDDHQESGYPALPSPEGRPALPASFEQELLSGSRTAYRLHRRFGRGAHGEVWRAVRRDDPSGVPLILKRLHQKSGSSAALLSGLRERHFGESLRGLPRLARLLEAFELAGSFWLAFRDEGISLRDLFYTRNDPAAATGGAADGASAGGESVVAMQPSALWLRLRLNTAGSRILRQLVRQLFEGLASLHAKNVTHRDIKPANTIVDLRGGST